MNKTLVSALTILAMAQAAALPRALASQPLVPHFEVGQTFSDVFSIMHWMKADGFDEHTGRNGGSADYAFVASDGRGWRFRSASRYYGEAPAHDEIVFRRAGRVICTGERNRPQQCQPSLEGTGLLYNPLLWGAPPKVLRAGMTWSVSIKRGWELGGADGTERVTVISVDRSTDTVLLLREGTSEGLFGEDEPSQRELTRNGRSETLQLRAGHAHWKGYARVTAGVMVSDELLVEREDGLRDKAGNAVHAVERWIMLLNAAPYPTLGEPLCHLQCKY